ncbi:TldD/PmbA family protein [Patescibacteria group bacterium]
MIGKKKLEIICQEVLGLSKADQAEVIIGSGESTTIRYANSYIHQPTSQLGNWIKVRLVIGKKIGVASGNQLDKTSLEALVNRAMEICRFQKDDPGFKSLPASKKGRSFLTYDEKTAKATSKQLARKVKVVTDQAGGKKLVASGKLDRSAGEMAVSNSLGVWAYQASTEANLSAIIMGRAPFGARLGSGSGYASDLGWQLDQIQEKEVAKTAVQKALKSVNPQTLNPGEYEVVLEPAAFEGVLDYFAWLGPNARVYHEDVSYFKGRLGKKVFSPKLTITDDPFDKRGLPASFDYEGQPKKRLPIVENGVIKNIAYDSYYAGKYKKKNTGHALPAPNTFGPLVSHLVVKPGKSSLSQMISKVKKGLLVTRFWYLSPVHYGQMLVTGMTRDGLFLIKNGAVVAPVKNLRFTESIPRMLKNIVEVGRDLLPLSSWGGGANLCPPVRISDFRFSGKTDF